MQRRQRTPPSRVQESFVPRADYSREGDVLHVFLEDSRGLRVRVNEHLTEIVSADDRSTRIGFVIRRLSRLVAQATPDTWTTVNTAIELALSRTRRARPAISTRIGMVRDQDIYLGPNTLAQSDS